MQQQTKPPLQRILDKLSPEPNTGCWLWLGFENRGYGYVWFDGNARRVHRIIYDLLREPIPEGMSVLHGCDVPLCCNPDHLFLGTQRDNMDDCRHKGRHTSIRDKVRTPMGRCGVCGREKSGDNAYRRPRGNVECLHCKRMARRREKRRTA